MVRHPLLPASALRIAALRACRLGVLAPAWLVALLQRASSLSFNRNPHFGSTCDFPGSLLGCALGDDPDVFEASREIPAPQVRECRILIFPGWRNG